MTVLQNQIFQAVVSIKNTGNTTWTTADGYYLKLQNDDVWGITEVPLPNSVAPNTTVDFTFNATAPLHSGLYNFNWGIVKDGVFFGVYCAQSINVAEPPVSPTATPTVTPTPSVTSTPNPTPTPTKTVTPTNNPTPTATLTNTPTPSISPSITPKETPNPTQTSTQTPTLTLTKTNQPTPTPTITPTFINVIIAPSNVVAYYKFDNNLLDSTCNLRDLSPVNSTVASTYKSGKVGQSIYYDTDQTVYNASYPYLPKITVAAWVKLNTSYVTPTTSLSYDTWYNIDNYDSAVASIDGSGSTVATIYLDFKKTDGTIQTFSYTAPGATSGGDDTLVQFDNTSVKYSYAYPNPVTLAQTLTRPYLNEGGVQFKFRYTGTAFSTPSIIAVPLTDRELFKYSLNGITEYNFGFTSDGYTSIKCKGITTYHNFEPAINDGKWHFVVWQVDTVNRYMTYKVDGILGAKATATTIDPSTVNRIVKIGGGSFQGEIDQLIVWDNIVSDSDLALFSSSTTGTSTTNKYECPSPTPTATPTSTPIPPKETWVFSNIIPDVTNASGGTGEWNHLRYLNNKFVALAVYGDLSYSSDAINWTSTDGLYNTLVTLAGATNTPYGISPPYGGMGGSGYIDITYGNGYYVLLFCNYNFDGGFIAKSTDLVNWTKAVTLPVGKWTSMTYGNNKFVVVSMDGKCVQINNTLTTLTSNTSYPNILAVKQISYPYLQDGDISLEYLNNKFIVVWSGGIAYSTDSATWTVVNYSFGYVIGSGGSKIGYGNGKYVISAGRGIYYTTDLSTINKTNGTNGDIGIAYGDNRFIAANRIAQDTYSLSDDGITWKINHDGYETPIDVWFSYEKFTLPTAIAYGNNRFVIFSSQGNNAKAMILYKR